MPRSAIIRSRRPARAASGATLAMAIVFLAVVVALVTIIFQRTQSGIQHTSRRINDQDAIRLAEAGIEKAVWCLNNPNNDTDCYRPGGPGSNFAGESNVSFGRGTFTTTVSGSGNNRTVNSTGTIRGSGGTSTRQVSAKLGITTNEISFQYGLQTGVGGLLMKNNNKITGNVFSNGSITGSKSLITNDVILGVRPVATDQSADPSISPLLTTDLAQSASALYLAQSFTPAINEKINSIELKLGRHGNPPGAFVAIYSDNNGSPGVSLYSQALTAPNDGAGWETVWTAQTFDPATTPHLSVRTKYWIVVRVGAAGDSNNYLRLVRDSDDTTYQDGTSKLSANGTAWSDNNADAAFKVNLGGITSTLRVLCEGAFCSNKVGVGGNAFADKIDGTLDVTGNYVKIGKHACYNTIVGTVAAGVPFNSPPGGSGETCSGASLGTVPCVNGNTGDNPAPYCHPGNPNLAAVDFPLTAGAIADMEDRADDGGEINGNVTVDNGEEIGPIKINGDLTIEAGAADPAVLNGTVWVNGNIFLNGTLKLSEGYGDESGVIIADKPTNPFGSGRFIVGNTGSLLGNSTADTYIMGLSTNTSLAEGTDPATGAAIAVSNNLVAGVVYAANGSVDIRNNADLKEVTGQKIIMQNNTSITYQSGLAAVVFSAGPGGSWIYQKGTYQIVD